MLSALPFGAAALYALAAALLARRQRQTEPGARTVPLALAAAALVLHATWHAVLFARFGPDLHFFASLSLVTLVTATIGYAVALARPVESLGVMIYPLAAAAAVAARAHDHEGPPALMEWQIALHVVLALTAFSVLALAAFTAATLAVQEHALRTRRVRALLHGFPPLTLVEGLLFHLIGAGAALLTATILTGALFIEDWFAQHLVHKTVLTIAAWFVFLALLFGHWRWGWRGRRAARLTLAGMGLLLLAFLGSKFVLEIVLERG